MSGHGETPSVKTPCFPRVASTSTQERSRQQETREDTRSLSRATENATFLLPSDPDLRRVVEAWERLPETIRAGILALVEAARGGSA
jgi:hypothetical protein